MPEIILKYKGVISLDATYRKTLKFNAELEDSANFGLTIPYPCQSIQASGGVLQATISWVAPTIGSPTAYKLYRGSTLIYTGVNLSYTDSISGGTYTYTIKAVYGAVESVGVSKQITIANVNPVTNLTAEDSGGSITLSWTAPAGQSTTGYKIKRNGSTIVSSQTALFYVDNDVDIDVNYTYQVIALIGSAESSAVSVVGMAEFDFDAFITTWAVSGTGTGLRITLPFYQNSSDCPNHPNCRVNWGDGTSSVITSATSSLREHYYASAGTYTVTITGSVPGWSFTDSTSGAGQDKAKMRTVEQWGNVGMVYLQNGFYGCTGLTSIAPNAPADVTDFRYTFCNCYMLSSLPDNLFQGCTNVTNFYATFNSCTGLTTLPDNLFQGCTKVTSFLDTFYTCSGLTTLPANLFQGCTNVISFSNTFSYCSKLTTIPANLFQGCTNATSFSYTFSYCSKLTINPNMFGNCFDSNPRTVNVRYLFYRTSWTGTTAGTAPALWNKTGITWNIGTSASNRPFYGAGNKISSITNYNDIPSDWKQ